MDNFRRWKVPFWIIVCILVPLIYLLLINPLFFGFILSPGRLGDKWEAKREVSSFLKDRYKQSFEIISFEKTNLNGGFEGRVLSEDDDIVFNVYKRINGEPRNDYLLSAWANPLISPFVEGNTMYEVNFSSSPLTSSNNDQDYRDEIFIKNPSELTIDIYLAYEGKMNKSQIYSIVENFKLKQIGTANIVLFPMVNAPDLKGVQKYGLLNYHGEHSDQFVDTCVINNYREIETEEDIVAGSECINLN